MEILVSFPQEGGHLHVFEITSPSKYDMSTISIQHRYQNTYLYQLAEAKSRAAPSCFFQFPHSNFRASKACVVFVLILGTAIMSEVCRLALIASILQRYEVSIYLHALCIAITYHSVFAATFSYPAWSKTTPDQQRTTSYLSNSSSNLPSSASLSHYRGKT